jgi:hypothetical protein
MQPKCIDLFNAYTQNLLTRQGGFLVSGRYSVPDGPIRYTVACLRVLHAAACHESLLSLEADGETMEIVLPTGTGESTGTMDVAARPLTRALSVAPTADRDFVFFFPAGRAATGILIDFLEKTFVIESSLPAEAAARTARRIVSLFSRLPEGIP